MSVHLRRIESYSQFPVVEFLALLFKYTFHQVQPYSVVFFLVFSLYSVVLSSRASLVCPVGLMYREAIGLSHWPSSSITGDVPSCVPGFSWRQQACVVTLWEQFVQCLNFTSGLFGALFAFCWLFFFCYSLDWKASGELNPTCLFCVAFLLNLLFLLYLKLSPCFSVLLFKRTGFWCTLPCRRSCHSAVCPCLPPYVNNGRGVDPWNSGSWCSKPWDGFMLSPSLSFLGSHLVLKLLFTFWHLEVADPPSDLLEAFQYRRKLFCGLKLHAN